MPQGISLQRWAVGTAALLLFADQGVQFLKRAQLVGPRAVPFRTVLLDFYPRKSLGGCSDPPQCVRRRAVPKANMARQSTR